MDELEVMTAMRGGAAVTAAAAADAEVRSAVHCCCRRAALRRGDLHGRALHWAAAGGRPAEWPPYSRRRYFHLIGREFRRSMSWT